MANRPLLHVLKATSFSLKTSGKKVDVLFYFYLTYIGKEPNQLLIESCFLI